MGTFFWEFQNQNDFIRQWILFSINTLALLFTLYSFIKTYKFYGACKFELAPLSVNVFATALLLAMKLFEKQYEYNIFGYLIEVFTYFLFCYTFSIIHGRVIQRQYNRRIKICNFVLFMLILSILVMSGLALGGIVSKDCENDLYVSSLIIVGIQIIFYIPTFYYGRDLLKKINIKQRQSLLQSDPNSTFNFTSDQYVKQRKNQIKLVLFAYTLSIIFRAFQLLLSKVFSSSYCCSEVDDVYIITSQSPIGEFILILVQINQLFPHLILPIAFYIIPITKNFTSQSQITFDNESRNSQEGQYNRDFMNQQRFSQSIVSRNSLSPQNKSIMRDQQIE